MLKRILSFILVAFTVIAGTAQTTYYAVTQNGQPSSGVFVIVDWDYPYEAILPWQAYGGHNCALSFEEEDDSRVVYEIVGAGSNGGRFFISIPKDDYGEEDTNYCLVEFFGYNSYRPTISTWCSTTPNYSSYSSGGYVGGNYNSGSSSSSSSAGRTCAGCNGTGRCSNCNGTGKIYLNTGYYTGQSYTKEETCSVCHGDGRCRVCYGHGVIR